MDTNNGAPAETETPSTSPVEPNHVEQTPPSGVNNDAKPIPFHEDPKVQDYINRQVESRLEKGLEQYKPVLDRFKPENDKVEIPYWFNGDDKQWQDFEKHLSDLSDRKAEEKIKAYQESQGAESRRITEANEWFASNADELEADLKKADPNAKLDRNKLLKIVMDNELIDSKGRWNYKAGYKLMMADVATPPSTVEQRKAIADNTRSDSKPEAKKGDVKTNQYFKTHKPW